MIAQPGVPDSCTPAWTQSVGVFNLSDRPLAPNSLQQVADRLMVTETVGRYAVAYDERRLDVISAIMTEDVVFSFRVGEGPLTSYSGRDAVIRWLSDVMQSQSDQRRHLVSPLLVEELTNGYAKVVAYSGIFAVQHEARLVTTNVYVFEFERRHGTWLITSVVDALDRPF